MSGKTKKILYKIILVIILIPFVVDFLLWKRSPITFGDDWQGFFGDYFGAIIGGLTAYLLLQLQRDADDEATAENNRSFVFIEEYYGHYRLKGAELSPNTKLVNTEEYQSFINEFKKNGTQEELEKGTMAFYKIGHKGFGETIFNCRVLVKAKGIDQNDQKHPFQQKQNLSMIEKGEEIYIPFVSTKYNEFEINSIEITYKTAVKEHIIYIYDLDSQIETYYHTEVKDENKIISSPIVRTNWIYPTQRRSI